jgi:hypothetical protein
VRSDGKEQGGMCAMNLWRCVLQRYGSLRRCKAAAGAATLLDVEDEVETPKCRWTRDTLHVEPAPRSARPPWARKR